MREYTLRDKSLLERLENIWPSFEIKLREASREGSYYNGVTVNTGVAKINFDWDVLELIPAYDPFDWNFYPEVKPPIGVLMLIDYQTASDDCLHTETALFGKDGKWHLVDMPGSEAPRKSIDGVIVRRFCRWC